MSFKEHEQQQRQHKKRRVDITAVEKPVRTSPLEDPITVAVESDAPVGFLENPNDVVPVDAIPESLKRAIVDTYGEKFLNETTWTRGRLRRLHKAIVRPRENLTNTIAQVCAPSCVQKDMCPYDIVGKAPLGERCPIELQLAKLSYDEYVRAVALRLNIDESAVRDDIILNNLIAGLVESDMVEARLNAQIAHKGFVTDVPVVVNQQTGEVYFKEDESVAVKIKERVARRKDQLYRQLLATPEMEERYKKRTTESSTQRIADALEKLIRTVEERRKLTNER